MNYLKQSNLQIPDLWEVRDVINKVKNVVLNYTEMEAKVHEATNNEAWGASSTLMQEIAQGTFNYQYFNEIMPTIYKRFTEKDAKQWRQIYKALILLEYLVKNGSERVVDDARSHIATIKMLRNFHHIDDKGKDQGISIRNRSKELADLLNSIDKIKEERKKAKKNRNKYIGTGSGLVGGGVGFGSDSYSSGYYDNMGGSKYDNDYESSSKYDDDDDTPSHSSSKAGNGESSSAAASISSHSQPATAKEANLFDLDEPSRAVDDEWGDFTSGNETAKPTGGVFDDFDDFQSAPTTAPAPASQTTKNTNGGTLLDLLGDDSFTTPVSNATPSALNAISTSSTTYPLSTTTNNPQTLTLEEPTATKPTKSTTIATGTWSGLSISLDSLNKSPKQGNAPKPSMNDMMRLSTQSGWSNTASVSLQPANTNKKSTSSPFDDLLL